MDRSELTEEDFEVTNLWINITLPIRGDIMDKIRKKAKEEGIHYKELLIKIINDKFGA